jgi:hypothetical protein
MRDVAASLAVVFLAVASGGCATRFGCRETAAPPVPEASAPVPGAPPAHVTRAARLLEEAKAREPHLAMMSEDAARAAMASMKEGYPTVPNLIRIAALAPKSMDAEMDAWDVLKKESTLDRRLVNEVFYVVSSANECGH